MAFHSYKQGDFGDALAEKQRSGYSGSEFVDPRWPGIGAQMADHELEEGEACDEPDLGCDPDTDFSYLDDKISRVLGDVQKCFEGGVSAETLGSKFGGYGSFLPTQERPQSNLHQDKPASALASDAYCRTKKSASEGFPEMIKQNATSTSMQATNLKTGRAEDNTGIPKKVTLRIKMGPEKSEKKNTNIYSDFGLSNSSSEAEDDFVDEDHRTDSDLESSPDRTPLTMIRIMTSHHIPDGMLLSPLPDLVTEPFIKKERRWSECQEEDVIDKARSPGVKKLNRFKGEEVCEKIEISKEKTKEHAGERIGDTGTSSDRLSKRAKVDKERGSSKESSRHSSKPPSKAYRKDLAKVNEIERQARDAVSESGTGVTSNESHKDCKGFSLDGGPPDYAMYDVDHMAKDFYSPSQAPPEVDSDRELHSRGYRIEKVASSNDSINEHLVVSHHGRDSGKEIVNTVGISLHGKREFDVSLELSDGKKRSSGKGFLLPGEEKPSSGHNGRSSTSKGSGAGKIAAPVTDVPTREMAESKKRLPELGQDGDGSRGTSREKGKGSSKEVHKSNVKDRYSKTIIPADLAMDEPPKDVQQLCSKTTFYKDYKESQPGDLPKGHKAESVENKRKEKAKRRVTPDYVSKEPSKVSDDRHRDLATRDMSTKNSHPTPEPVNNDLPSQAGALPPPPAGNGVTPYVLVMDNWVECDKCKQWRLLPPGVGEADLPQKWHCKMLHWLEKEGLNNCSALEEVTNQMTRAVYNMSAPIPPPVVDNTAAVEQIQPPVALVTSIPPSNAAVNQEIKPPEKTRGSASFKKHKAPRTSSSDNIVPGKSKNIADSAQIIQDVSQTKPAGGDTITSQEKIQAKVVGPYVCPSKTGEEKLKVKERDKSRRHRSTDGSSPSGKKQSQTPANLALREATKLKHKADSLKGQERASTALYLQAALKFLQAASMLESEPSEHGDSRHGPLPVKLYADTGKLCEYCASTYERNKDLAAAAISYKCAGVARMRVVQAKNLHINKCRAEVQSAQHVAQGDSPTSSTKVEMDALKNSASDGPFVQGSNASMAHSHTGGPLIIAAKSRASFAQIMDYVMDTSKALDAMAKSLHAFSGAESALSSCTIEGISALKRVLDYSFHDVDNFVQLVRIALEAMGH